MNTPTKAYRYEDVTYASGDEYDVSFRTVVELREYDVTKTTKHGFWIEGAFFKRFVKTKARKKFAHLTKEDALISFRARKLRQAFILERQLDRVRHALRIIPTS